jgi:hypothetical protein
MLHIASNIIISAQFEFSETIHSANRILHIIIFGNKILVFLLSSFVFGKPILITEYSHAS